MSPDHGPAWPQGTSAVHPRYDLRPPTDQRACLPPVYLYIDTLLPTLACPGLRDCIVNKPLLSQVTQLPVRIWVHHPAWQDELENDSLPLSLSVSIAFPSASLLRDFPDHSQNALLLRPPLCADCGITEAGRRKDLLIWRMEKDTAGEGCSEHLIFLTVTTACHCVSL